MSAKIAFAACALLATSALLPAATTPAQANTVCRHVAGVPHVVCREMGGTIGNVNPNRHCYYLPTVANGRVTGVEKVCS
jgi:hypothetical protein